MSDGTTAVDTGVAEDNFEAAFDEAVAGTAQEVTPAPDPAPEPAADPAPDADPAPAANPEPEPAPAIDYAAELARLQAELDTARLPAKAEPEARQAEPEPVPEPLLTPEQETAMANFRKEWPEVAAGMDLMMQAQLKQMQAQLFAQLAPTLNPLIEGYQVSAEEKQYAAIKAAHADYDTIYNDVLAWVDKQPAYMKNALQQVVAEGTAADVVDMISRYKLEAGKGNVAPAPITAPTSKVADLPEAAKKVARSLGVVSSKRSATPQSQDPTDFDGAWAEAIAANG